jgi:GTP-binding protein
VNAPRGTPGRAEFAFGVDTLDRLPPEQRPEIAVAGRSNVGKSSLLNRLTGRRALARVSKTPGRTQQINFFSIDDRVVLVDLPGYGFARVPLPVKDQWRRLVEGYLTRRRVLRGVLVLVDVRRGIEPDDAQLLAFLAAHRLPARVVVTKVDKLGRGARTVALARFVAAAGDAPPLPVSGVTGEGTAALWQVIDDWAAD